MKGAGGSPVPSATTTTTYVVDDASGLGAPVEVMTPIIVGTDRPEVSTERRGLLESLIFLGSASKTVDLGGCKFKLSTLSNQEHNQLVKELYRFGAAADVLVVRTLTLALALKTVNDVLLEDLPTDQEYDSVVAKKSAIVDSMQQKVVSKLYDEYEQLVESVDKQLSGPEIKN